MQSIEQFRAEQLAAVEKATQAHAKRIERAECFGNAGLPVPEYIADGNLYGAISVTYRNQTIGADAKPRSMADAIELFRQFADTGHVIACHVLRNGCTTIHPEQHMPANKNYKRDTGRQSGAYAAELRIYHMAKNHNTSATLEFFATLGGKLFGVSIEFGRGYIGRCDALAPRGIETRGYGNRVQSREFKPNPVLYGAADTMLSFSFGGDVGALKSGADHRFLFVADHDEDGPVQCTHALAQLQSVAEQTGA